MADNRFNRIAERYTVPVQNKVDYSKLNWDQLVAQARADHQRQWETNDSFDPYTGGMTNIGGGNAQIMLRPGNEFAPADYDMWDNVVFNVKDPSSPDPKQWTSLSRGADGGVNVGYYMGENGVDPRMLAVLAAPFIAAAAGVGAGGTAATGTSGAGIGVAEAAGTTGGTALGSGLSTGASGVTGVTGTVGAGGGFAGTGGLGLTTTGVSSGALGTLGTGSFGAETLAGIGAAGGAAASGGGYGASGLSGSTAGTGSSGLVEAAGSNATSGSGGLLSSVGDKMANMSISDWINAAGTVGGIVGADRAADAMEDGANAATAEQRRQYDQTRADWMPWMDAGRNALTQMSAGTAPNGEFSRNFTEADFWADPVIKLGYQSGLDEGRKGISRQASATGSLDSGKILKELTRFGTDYTGSKGNESFGRFNINRDSRFNKLASLAGIGQVATGSISNAGTNMANNVGQNMMGAGNARAAGYIGGVNALNNGISQWANTNQSNRLMDAVLGGGGSNSGYGNWGTYNSGVMNSTGLNANDLWSAF